MNTFSFLLLLWSAWPLLSAALSCLPCEPSACTTPSDCPSGTALDACGCCQVCAKANEAGERCGGPQNIACGSGLVCVADRQSGGFGTCRALCLSYGCYIDKNECLCEYSYTCPIKTFQYSSKDECEAKLSTLQCEAVICPTTVCPPGMSYVPYPVAPGECCPAGGDCVCDFRSCTVDTVCLPGTVLTVVKPRNPAEMNCCDILECQTPRVDQTCHNGSAVFQLGDVWRAGCSTCTCFEGDRISCVLPACPLLDCNETTIATDECCPVCSSSNVILSTATILRVASSDCTSSAGHVYRDGASWVEGDCNHCVCSGGNTLCSQPSCYLGNCTTFVTPPGACCPACIDDVVHPGSGTNTEVVSSTEVNTVPPSSDVQHTSVSSFPSESSTAEVETLSVSAHGSKTLGDISSANLYPAKTNLDHILLAGLGAIFLTVFLSVSVVASIVALRRLRLRHKKLEECQSNSGEECQSNSGGV
eukprot:Em0705g2a